ncbi:DNA cytosine methyltransferase [Sediminibacterium ginsengisoli]|uniref:Cytosine-specific methyltransferase n=1 Tax=Sediminibacterium ginsengisoli TaxID=413434 RepID=A0A1T4RXU4_9BACT|nr:DNA cytosine methyltransferase [Sediminibacterium ginsengisoli]SKA20747.1 DNA (cytosine-5)-methyltransferase 1 [Sediminibacterium ginsengisoli]
MSFKYIDLFAGAGGLSEGFIRAGFEPVAHVEMDKAACYTLKTRVAYHYLKKNSQFDIYISYLKGEITRSQLYSKIPDELLNSVINLPIGAENNSAIHKAIETQLKGQTVDLIIGGPPCQAYSLVGRARSENGMKGDHRNYLYVHYAKFLEKYSPKLFVFENVIGLLSAGNGKYLSNMQRLFEKKGYEIRKFNVEANNFGVLQKRKRIIIIGWKQGLNYIVPDLLTIKINSKYAVQALLNDLPKVQAGETAARFTKYRAKTNEYLTNTAIRNGINILTQHIARPHTQQDKEIYRIAVNKWNNKRERLNYNDLPERLKTHQNRKSFFDRFKVVAADEAFSQTVVAHISKDGHYYIHPDIEQNRSLTIREAARLQSFPDDYFFEGIKEGIVKTPAFKQIGNAVPPLMAEAIARQLFDILNK